MEHYGELRMQFLGGEEEARMKEDKGMSVAEGKMSVVSETPGENAEKEEIPDVQSLSPRSSSPLLPESEEEEPASKLAPCHSFGENSGEHHDPNIHVKQHRYSLQVEKVPVALRSNTALFNYFNEMFPGQVHSVCVSMNVPDLEALSVRRLRVARRLEKSLAYFYATGMRPTHITGRPRFQCCGIESTPIDGMCLVCCCCYDSCQMGTLHDDETNPEHITDQLPDKGECVDSISYYTLDLALCNIRLKKMQKEKFLIAESGQSIRPAGEEKKDHWYKPSLGWAKDGAAKTAASIRDEFEVVSEEDELFQEKQFRAYGTIPEKKAALVQEDHYVDSDSKVSAEISGRESPTPRRRLSKAHLWMRALLWRMGLDFLAAGLDEVQDRTNVVVDSVTRPSMSSTGFVTFKTITPVTVSTSAPLTYDGNAIEVFVAPETRDIVWKNVQVRYFVKHHSENYL